MTSVWKLFYYSCPKAEVLKGKQAVLGFPELMIVKSSNTRWLLHARYFKAICKKLLPVLYILSQLYESSGDAEAYDIYSLLASVNGVSSNYLLSVVLSTLALLNLFMYKCIADFSKLHFMLKSTLDHLNSIRERDASWYTAVETAMLHLETEHGIVWKLPPFQFMSFEYKWLFPTLIHW